MRHFIDYIKDKVEKNVSNSSVQSTLKFVIEKIMQNYDEKIIKDSCLTELFQIRLNWLTKNRKEKPVFSWCMKEASFPKYPKLEMFFKSHKLRCTFSGVFKDIDHVKSFVMINNAPDGTNYSCTMIADKMAVRILKTKIFFDKKMKEFESIESDIEWITAFLSISS